MKYCGFFVLYVILLYLYCTKIPLTTIYNIYYYG